MSKYSSLLPVIADGVGGVNNIVAINHCATRLRITVKSTMEVNSELITSEKQVMGCVTHDNELQFIIGPDVPQLYNEFVMYFDKNSQGHTEGDNPSSQTTSEKRDIKHYFQIAIDFVSGTFVPVLPVLVAAGLISAVLNIGVTFFGLSSESGTYITLNAINNAGFYFLPVFLGYSAARKLGINPIMGLFLGAVLIDTTINGLENLEFLSVHITTPAYAQTTFPVIFGVLFMYIIDKITDRYIPDIVKFFAKPLIVMIITVPVTLIALAPLGNWIGAIIALGLGTIYAHFSWFAVGLVGAGTPLMVMTGTNQATFPLVFANMAELGYDNFVMTGMLAANTAVGAAALAQIKFMKTDEEKGLAMSAGITGVLGITEPSIFGVLLNYKNAFYGAIIGGGIGGLFAGIIQVKQYAVVSPGIAALPTFIPTDGSGLSANFWLAVATIIISITCSYIATTILYKK